MRSCLSGSVLLMLPKGVGTTIRRRINGPLLQFFVSDIAADRFPLDLKLRFAALVCYFLALVWLSFFVSCSDSFPFDKGVGFLGIKPSASFSNVVL